MDPLHLDRDFMLEQLCRARRENLGPLALKMVDSIGVRFLVKEGAELEAAALLSARWLIYKRTSDGAYAVWGLEEPRPADLGEVLCWHPPDVFKPIPAADMYVPQGLQRSW